MRRTIATTVLLALVICGCSTRGEQRESVRIGQQTIEVGDLNGFNAALYTPPDPYAVKIYITDGEQIVIDQEPVRRTPKDVDVTLAWRLQDETPPRSHSFPDNTAIALQGTGANPLPKDLACGTVGPKKRVFVCTYTRTGKAQWKYTVRVKNDQTGAELTKLDPWVHQE